MATLARIAIYPIKALDAREVETARIAPRGALAFDRRWAFLDEAGDYVNGKNEPAIHRIRARYEPDADGVTLSAGGHETRRFGLPGDGAAMAEWVSRVVGRRVRLEENVETGFPDDLEAPGPTIVSEATLETVASWFPGVSAAEVRRRFRVNLVIGGVEPFWEDRLYGPAGATVRFRVGQVRFEGTNPCRRCGVPSRNPETGEALAGFQKTFTERRRETLPPWAEASRFDTYYRLTVNTRVPASEAGREIRLGDVLHL